jgi:hypothetical protein
VILDVIHTAVSGLIGYLIAVWQSRRADKQSKATDDLLKRLPFEFL